MQARHRRLVLWSGIALALAAALAFAFRPQPVAVDVVEISPAPMIVTVDEEGQTRVEDVFVVSAPVTGRLRRIELEVGDPVVANQSLIAEIEPIDPTLLDPRTEAQARSALEAARSARELAEAEAERAEAELDFARAELERMERLFADGTISERELDQAERAYRTAKAAYSTALAALQVANFELEQAEAQLMTPAESRSRAGLCECVPLLAPVDGRILRIPNESERVVQAGEPLVEIGDPEDLEIVVDLLSTDAVSVEAGQRAIVDNWGGERPLEGRVRRVEPFGFTKVSALGIEEQRVNVVIDFTGEKTRWQKLGHGYQVGVRIVLWEADDTLAVPLTALFRQGEDWAVFVVEDGRAVARTVEVGRRNGAEAQIREGIEPGEAVVLHPSDRVQAGVRVARRA
jgi:HlyD family secretion protein